VWLAAGHTGSTNDFLASLVGAQGQKGDIGAMGAVGQAGFDGAPGPAGSQGPRGFSGVGGYQPFTQDGTFIVPEGVNRLLVEAWGAGGNSHTYINARADTCAGSSGQYIRTYVAVTPGQTLKVRIGSGGTAATGFGSTTWILDGSDVALAVAAGGYGRTGETWSCNAPATNSDATRGGEYAVIRPAGPPASSLLPSVLTASVGRVVENSVTGFVCCNPRNQSGGNGEVAIEW